MDSLHSKIMYGKDGKVEVHVESVDGVHSFQRELADAAYHQCLVNLCVETDNRAKFYGGTGNRT